VWFDPSYWGHVHSCPFASLAACGFALIGNLSGGANYCMPADGLIQYIYL